MLDWSPPDLVPRGYRKSQGDTIVGDEDGVVVVRREEAEEVLARVHARKKQEREWFEAVARGETILEDTDDDLIARGARLVD